VVNFVKRGSMNVELERKLIIDELSHVHEEWLLKAIKKLLGLGIEEIPDHHAEMLDDAIQAFEAGKEDTIEWDQALKMLSGGK
jgi:hypothetical protein